ncbi:MAG: nucleotide exchange factor GrpE [Verrucomicrobiales bacterium]|nr:nucleotide exchange factor GrpE [Verrucomicrobiales bacterium]
MSSPETPAAPEAAPETAETPSPESAPPSEVARLSAELAAAQDRLLRLAADFDNFKKRAARERDDARKNGTESVLGKLLPVLDNFDMAMAAGAQPNTTLESLKTGVTMIHGQFRSLLGDLGVTALEATGQPFDPSLHEAVSTCPAGEVPDGHVAQQVRRGYRFGDRLLRPASVVVASKSA